MPDHDERLFAEFAQAWADDRIEAALGWANMAWHRNQPTDYEGWLS